MKEIISIIENHTAGTAAKSGITLVQISHKAAMPVAEVKEILDRVVSSGEVREREGINQQLYFKN